MAAELKNVHFDPIVDAAKHNAVLLWHGELGAIYALAAWLDTDYDYDDRDPDVDVYAYALHKYNDDGTLTLIQVVTGFNDNDLRIGGALAKDVAHGLPEAIAVPLGDVVVIHRPEEFDPDRDCDVSLEDDISSALNECGRRVAEGDRVRFMSAPLSCIEPHLKGKVGYVSECSKGYMTIRIPTIHLSVSRCTEFNGEYPVGNGEYPVGIEPLDRYAVYND